MLKNQPLSGFKVQLCPSHVGHGRTRHVPEREITIDTHRTRLRLEGLAGILRASQWFPTRDFSFSSSMPAGC